MRFMPRLHDTYVGQVVLVTVLLAWAVLVGLDVVMALSGEIGDLGTGNYTFGHAVAWVLYTVPRRAYTMFPTAAVIGSLMGLGQLAASSELTALRALGLSRRRLSISVAAALALLTGLMVVSGETLGPWGQRQADTLKMSARTGNVAISQEFVNRYVALEPLPKRAQPGDRLVARGTLLPGSSDPLVNIAYQPFPQPLTLEQLNQTGTYKSAAEHVAVPQIRAEADGRFVAEYTIDKSAPAGLYHVWLWVRTPGLDEPVQAVNAVIEVSG